jgi:methionyl-tRNA synthetase
MSKFYITASIPYVNAKPHIGHALEYVQVSAIARYHRLFDKEVLTLSGGDENALKNVQAAEKAGRPIQEFVDENTEAFRQIAIKLNAEFDLWQKGSDQKHHFPASQKLWELCAKNGDIYKKKYKGLYCIGCEAFYTPDELNESGECFEHPGKKLEEIEEENWFFNLSRYQDKLIKLIESNQLKIIPDFRRNEVLSFLKSGLQDLSISRSNERAKNWGVPVPGDPTQRCYVWFDALNIYQSAIGFGWDEKTYAKWWPADVHVIGKGITRFHAVYWPAFLLSAGLKLPKTVFVHGYLTVNGEKISKTIGNVIDPFPLIEKYGADAIRYYLLAKISPFGDGDFSEDKLVEVYNADLANGLGNTVARLAKLAERSKFEFKEAERPREIYSHEQKEALNDFELDIVLSNIWVVHLQLINKHIDQHAPWAIKDTAELKQVLAEEISLLVELAWKIKPFLPGTSEMILKQFSGGKVVSQPPLFPRI